MADIPILFSGPMVRALLAGTKTQTRRVVKPQPELQMNGFYHVLNAGGGCVGVPEEDVGGVAIDYVRYAAGDRLWVKETWRVSAQDDHRPPRDLAHETVGYVADESLGLISRTGKARPSMFMPRWASRLTLHVTAVRVQRLQDISGEDAAAEGIEYLAEGPGAGFWIVGGTRVCAEGSVEAYEQLWEHINGPGSWGADPWVVAISFTVERATILSALAHEGKT